MLRFQPLESARAGGGHWAAGFPVLIDVGGAGCLVLRFQPPKPVGIYNNVSLAFFTSLLGTSADDFASVFAACANHPLGAWAWVPCHARKGCCGCTVGIYKSVSCLLSIPAGDTLADSCKCFVASLTHLRPGASNARWEGVVDAQLASTTVSCLLSIVAGRTLADSLKCPRRIFQPQRAHCPKLRMGRVSICTLGIDNDHAV